MYPALLNSLLFAAVTATLVLLVGVLLVWIVERTDARVRLMADMFVLAPIVMPAVILVNGWIMLLSPRSGMINLMATSWLGMAGHRSISSASRAWSGSRCSRSCRSRSSGCGRRSAP